MIVPMKKIAIITRSIDAQATVKDLRSLGLLHVEHQGEPLGRDITTLQEELVLLNSALGVFANVENIKKLNPAPEKINTDWQGIAKHLIDSEKRLKQLEMYSEKLQLSILEWQNWGDFHPEKLEALAAKGIYSFFYQVPLKKLDGFPKEAVVKTIYSSGGVANVIVFSQKKLEVSFKEIVAPKQSLSNMRQRLLQDTQLIHSLKDEIHKMSGFYQEFVKVKQELEKEMELQQAIKGMANFGALSIIMGYVPADQIERLMRQAHSKQWGMVIQDPQDTDNVPVLLRNPAWVALIRPIFKFLEILPGYRELDISLVFLIFFSIFFGILIGDAGYGLVYFLITFWLAQKARKKNQDTKSFYLFYILSYCAIVWGFLTGTFFGQEWVLKAGYKPPIPALINDKGLQRFCFFLGALHLSIAHSWRAALKAPSLSALADVGWICVLWASFFIAKVLILGDSFPFFTKWLIIGGIGLVIIFTNPQKNILKGIGEGLGTLALSIMNNFTDVVSYIRLFAVGMAGVAIADAFNAMAGMLGSDNLFSILASVLIVLIGNSLGMVLGPVSVLVHGVRLNVLEFSGHAGISWSGTEYKPLKE